MAAQPIAVTQFYVFDMILNVHSDALYLTASKAQSRAGGYFFLGKEPVDNQKIFLNILIHVTCSILKNVAASAAEDEPEALFLNTKEAKIL